jgi:hypothetical protein
LPKKTNRRPARARTKSRSVQARANGATAVREPDNGLVPQAVASPVVSTGATPVPPARRAAGVPRKAPATVADYAYLRRDLRLLGILAPSMIVLVVIAFFLFH